MPKIVFNRVAYRIIWCAAVGWWMLVSIAFYKNYEYPMDWLNVVCLAVGIGAEPLALLMILYRVITGKWRFGWNG